MITCCWNLKILPSNGSVRREHGVFMNLIDSYPGLLDRLTKGEEEDIIHVGELVSSLSRKIMTLTLRSWEKEPLVREATIPRHSNLPSSNGLCPEDKQSYRPSPGISSLTVALITKSLVHCYAPQASTGQTQSKFCCLHIKQLL
jgi:hypothetical protein